jgi:hypothetical protein
MGLLQKTRTQAGLLCECSGNIELHLAAKLGGAGSLIVRGAAINCLNEQG